MLAKIAEAFKFSMNLLNRHPVHRQLALFVVCLAASFLIFFFRNPDPFINPVFYTEDGRNYVGPILSKGFWSALFYARSDYFVFGNIILSGIAVAINNIFFPSSILYLPQIIALVSYKFYAIVATIPILLFADRVKTSYLIALALISSFFSLHTSDYEVIGRISNIGYAFVYIAFLLISYRLFCLKRAIIIIVIDLLILVCASTNPIVYLMVPVVYISYLKEYFTKKTSLNTLLRDFSFLSATFIGVILFFQIVKIITGPGVSSVPGHLDSPFVFSNAIEMFIARSMLYPVIYSVYESMNDLTVISIFIIIIICFLWFSNKKNYSLYIFGFYSLIVFTIMAAVFRPGLSGLLKDYSSTWPDRYYYGQNLLATFLIVLLFNDISSRISMPSIRNTLLMLMLTVFLASLGDVSTYGNPAEPLRQIGNFEQTLVVALREKKFVTMSEKPKLNRESFTYSVIPDKNGKFVELPIYPPPLWKMTIPRNLVEKSVAQGKLINTLDRCQ